MAWTILTRSLVNKMDRPAIALLLIGIIAILLAVFLSDRNEEATMARELDDDVPMTPEEVIDHYEIPVTVPVEKVEPFDTCGLDRYIGLIHVIPTSDDNKVLQEIDRLGIDLDPDCIKIVEFENSERYNNKHMLGHVFALGHANGLDRNVFLCESGFEFEMEPAEIMKRLDMVEEFTQGRWDVVVFGQYAKEWQLMHQSDDMTMCRLLNNSTTSGYLVNRHYIPKLLSAWGHAHARADKHNENIHLEDEHVAVQKKDLWIGFSQPIGKTTWSSKSLTDYTDGRGRHHHLTLKEPFTQKRIAFVIQAISQDIPFLQKIQNDLFVSSFKGHLVEFHVYTNHVALFSEETSDGAKQVVRECYEGTIFDCIQRSKGCSADYLFAVGSKVHLMGNLPNEHLIEDIVCATEPGQKDLVPGTHYFGGPRKLLVETIEQMVESGAEWKDQELNLLDHSFSYPSDCLTYNKKNKHGIWLRKNKIKPAIVVQ